MIAPSGIATAELLSELFVRFDIQFEFHSEFFFLKALICFYTVVLFFHLIVSLNHFNSFILSVAGVV